ncbi:beta-ketoacyl synthase chain length factor [Oleisolibacter albus]|uniref:beta-ketoacyl synthase chain length factor n=1 Tax=Oleisolibacter albus TaxID=2171757 RepID=UPI00138FEE2B|nr:beta-ketoacyl synthase chain length factor [Oleisolibacter albus]
MLKVQQWSACLGNISTQTEWSEWLDGARVPDPSWSPKLDFLPPLQYRRYSRLSRLALSVARSLLQGNSGRPHLVFASRFGEYDVTYALLCALAKGELLSPAAFSMSVHNTGAALCSITNGLDGHATAIAAGPDSLEFAVLESWSLLQAGEAEDVLMVYAEEPLPDCYGGDPWPPAGGGALGLRLTRADMAAGGTTVHLGWRAGDGFSEETTRWCVQDLVPLLLGRSTHLSRRGARFEWTWSQHGPA